MKFRIMKYLPVAAATMLAAAATACHGSGDNTQGAADSLPVASTFEDSLSLRLGTQWGAQQAINFALLDEDKRESLDMDQFIAGLRSAVMSDYETPGMIEAIAFGSDLAGQLDSYNGVGVCVRPGRVIEAFESVFMADTLTSEQADEYQGLFDEKMSVVQNLILDKMRKERRAQTLMAEKMRKENVEKGKAYLEEKVKEDSQVKQSKSGLYYKIESAGNDKHPSSGSTVNMIYSIKGVDGRMIDSSRGEAVDIPFNGDLIAGLQEGLAMIGEGARATFYIPSKLGFSRDNSGVDPGELIIVEVEIKGVK